MAITDKTGKTGNEPGPSAGSHTSTSSDAADLRRIAEERLQAREQTPQSGIRNPESEQRLVHELQVHQIELEMQNEELQQARTRTDGLLAQYTDLYDFAPAGYLTLDREGTIRLVNLTGALLLGVERSGLVNRRFGLFVAEGDRRAFSDFLVNVFASAAKERCEVTLRREGSPPLVVRIEGQRSEDRQECRAVVLDVTARRQAEEQARAAAAETQRLLAASDLSRRTLLSAAEDERRAAEAMRESEERYAALFRGAAEGILVADLEARTFSLANPAICKMLGYSEEEMKRLSVADIHPAESLEHVLAEFDAQVRGERLLSPGLPCRRKDGSVMYADIAATSMVLDNRLCNVGFFSDVTERKRAEERIIRLNRILRALRDINQLIVRERDRQRLIENACRVLVESRAYESAMIVLADEARVPRAWAESGMGDAFQPLAESLQQAVLPECCRMAQQHEGVCHVTDRAGVCSLCPIWDKSASTDASCIQLRHGQTTYGYLAVSVDRVLGADAEAESLLAEVAGDVAYALHGIVQNAAMAQAEEDRDRVTGELRQSQKLEAIGRLAGGVAHDFNNLLTVINTSCSFIEEELREADPVREDLRTILEASQSAATLTRQLLAFSRRQVLQPQTLDLNTLVGGMQKMLSRLLGEDIIILFTPSPALGLVRADPGQVEQVIVNLAVNARDAMPEGGTLTLETKTADVTEAYAREHGGKSAGRYAKVTVADTGCGMDPEILARAFEPFFTTKPLGRGTGLGLSTVYGIAQQSGGLISVSSEVARGTTFSLYLPLERPDAQAWYPATVPEISVARGETILLVEDNAQLRANAARSLRKMGYRVFEASGLEEARRSAEAEGVIHLVLTDVVMPGGSGRAVSDAVLASHPGVKVLYMSGFTDDAIVQHHVLEQGVALLQKPFTPDSLGRKVREALDAP